MHLRDYNSSLCMPAAGNKGLLFLGKVLNGPSSIMLIDLLAYLQDRTGLTGRLALILCTPYTQHQLGEADNL